MMSEFRTIKALVFDHVHRNKGVVCYEDLTKDVLAHFPTSAWKSTHWAWYRYQILRGRFKEQFTEEERRNLKLISAPCGVKAPATRPSCMGQRGPAPRDPKVKEIGDPVIKSARATMRATAGTDEDLYFRINRWVFSRLHSEEIRTKRPIKKKLWDSGQRACQACGEIFKSLKGVEIHRKSPMLRYSAENCELLCRDCHGQILDRIT